MPNDAWRPSQYERFKAERSRPFWDLIALVRPHPDMTVLDLGCGTAELTLEAHRSLGARHTVAVDRSAAMLERAKGMGVAELELVQANLVDFVRETSRRFDLVLSNAALHWVPDHEAVFAAMAAVLSEGGQLAVQVPVNHGQAPHRVAAHLAEEEPFASALGGVRERRPILELEAYARLLQDLGFTEQRVRVELYTHLLEDRGAVVEWVKGTTLTWYEERLPPELYLGFVERYRERLYAELPDTKPFVFTFRRLFVWGKRG